MTVSDVREIFDEHIITPGWPPLPRFGHFTREQVKVLFDEVDRLGKEAEEKQKEIYKLRDRMLRAQIGFEL